MVTHDNENDEKTRTEIKYYSKTGKCTKFIEVELQMKTILTKPTVTKLNENAVR